GRIALDRLRASVAANPRRSSAGQVVQKWFGSFAEWLGDLAPPKLAMAAAAAALVIAVQGVVLGSLIANRPAGSSYETASGPRGVAQTDGTYALVAFAPGAPAATLTSFLAESGLQIV